MSSFEFTDEDGDHFACRPMLGIPAILLRTDPNGVVIPLSRLEEIIAGQRDMARQAAYTAAYHQPARFPGDSPAMRAAVLSCVRPERRDLTVVERQFLTFALDLASDRMASRGDEFTDEDQAALDRFRSMSTGSVE